MDANNVSRIQFTRYYVSFDFAHSLHKSQDYTNKLQNKSRQNNFLNIIIYLRKMAALILGYLFKR